MRGFCTRGCTPEEDPGMRGFCTRGCTPEEDPGSREIGGIGLSRSSGRTPSNLRLQQQRQAATVKATPPPMPPIAAIPA